MDNDYIEIVRELNTELYERFGEFEHNFSYATNGFVDCITFNDHLIWDSENDEREWLDDKNEYEPFIPFLKRVFNEYADSIMELKF